VGVQLCGYGLTDKGRVRPTNEDCFAVREDLGLCVVADGMGGHNAGEIAAQLAVDAVVGFVAAIPDRVGAGSGSGADDDVEVWPFGFDRSLSVDGNLLRTAVHLADVRVRDVAMSSCDCAGMGTTIVVARVHQGRLSVAHVGDSRLYVLSGRALRQVTEDDSWMASMIAHEPAADRFFLEHHPMRHALTNAVGTRSRTEVHVAEQPLAGGELLLLTTDGIHATLDIGRMAQIAGQRDQPQAIADALIQAALLRGSCDNCTAVVARCDAMG
jgi:serine/threonine protein phosphatase PrpC